MRSIPGLALSLSIALSHAACSSTTVAPDTGADASVIDSIVTDTGPDTNPADTARDVSPADVVGPDVATDAGPGPSPCPDTPVTGACTSEGLECTYGDDPRSGCRTRLSCTSGAWQLTSPRCVPITGCSPSPAAGTVCPNSGDVCVATDGTRCDCDYCPHGGPACAPIPPARWFCNAPPGDANCPRTMPNLGGPCGPAGTACSYDGCGSGMAVVCTAGIWVQDIIPCPL
ncbi:MAG: hypothetical protein WCJ30_04515 [Deltaproteobacteria bacterium]